MRESQLELAVSKLQSVIEKNIQEISPPQNGSHPKKSLLDYEGFLVRTLPDEEEVAAVGLAKHVLD